MSTVDYGIVLPAFNVWKIHPRHWFETLLAGFVKILFLRPAIVVAPVPD
jgi:hypothetical protein